MTNKIVQKFYKNYVFKKKVINQNSEHEWRKPTFPKDDRQLELLLNKNVLITGAGRNIGRCIALQMAQQGANIYFTDIVRDRLKKVEQEISEFNVRTKGFLSDISNNAHILDLVGILEESNLNIDILINNVGVRYDSKNFIDSKMDEWTRTYATNLFGPIYLTKLISQLMIKNKISGSIIFITSIHEDLLSRWPSYSSSKSALNMVIKELAFELAAYEIKVNGIAPGAIEDEVEKQKWPHVFTPLNKNLVDSRYIGRAAVYLASDYFSKQTTGTILKIDAGLSLYSHRVAEQ